jgi:N-acetylneuraminate lyase
MRLEGLIAATFTAFDENGKVNTTGIQAMVDRLVKNMVSGIYICGSTGEGHSLTIAERKILAEHFIKAAGGRIPTIVNVGHNCLEDASELARHAQAAGADAISAAPPTYYSISSPLQLVKVLSKIAEAAPNLPFFYYHIPAITRVEISMEAFLNLGSR